MVRSTLKYRWWLAAILLISLCFWETSQAQTPDVIAAADTAAQTQSDSPVLPKPRTSLERQFFKNILHDQAVIWTAPFHLKGNDSWVLVPLGVSTVALIASDRHTAGLIGKSGSQLTISRHLSRMGAAYTTFGVASAFYLIGRHTGNDRARETGLLAGEALIDGTIVYSALKGITQRPRPNEADGHGRFFTSGNSFPSGHAVQAWTLATVIAKEYRDKPLVGVTMYGLASVVSLSRYSGRRHFLSDVVIGSAMGYGIGRYVYKNHHDPSLDAAGSKARHLRVNFIPRIAPYYSPRASLYGATLIWEH